MEFQVTCTFFDALSPLELYRIHRLRNEVFIVEQRCVFQDADNKDPQCHHLQLLQGNELVAYARLVPPGLAYPQMSIGRVASSPAARGTGAGKALMQQAIAHCAALYGPGDIKIGAQLYLKKFYESFGFVQCSEVYDEDGIDHVLMLRETATLPAQPLR